MVYLENNISSQIRGAKDFVGRAASHFGAVVTTCSREPIGNQFCKSPPCFWLQRWRRVLSPDIVKLSAPNSNPNPNPIFGNNFRRYLPLLDVRVRIPRMTLARKLSMRSEACDTFGERFTSVYRVFCAQTTRCCQVTKTHVIDFDQSRARILNSERRSYIKIQ